MLYVYIKRERGGRRAMPASFGTELQLLWPWVVTHLTSFSSSSGDQSPLLIFCLLQHRCPISHFLITIFACDYFSLEFINGGLLSVLWQWQVLLHFVASEIASSCAFILNMLERYDRMRWEETSWSDPQEHDSLYHIWPNTCIYRPKTLWNKVQTRRGFR